MSSLPSKATIKAIASYLPEKVLSNADLEKLVDTSNEWIVTRTGIKERRIARPDEFPSTMGAQASKMVLQRTNTDPRDIDLIIVTTMTPDYLCPSTAALIQAAIGAVNAAAFDMLAACTGFIYGLSIAKAYIDSGAFRRILLVSTEKNSAFVDYTDRSTCIVFGDGASACLICQDGPGLSIGPIHLGASGNEADLLQIPAGGARLPASPTSYSDRLHSIKMNGKEVFKHAVKRMEESILACLTAASLTPKDIRWLVPHQANLRIIDALAKRLDIDEAHVVVTIDTFANTSSSTIPIAIDTLFAKKAVQSHDRILITAFGGGLTWGTAILTAKEGNE